MSLRSAEDNAAFGVIHLPDSSTAHLGSDIGITLHLIGSAQTTCQVIRLVKGKDCGCLHGSRDIQALVLAPVEEDPYIALVDVEDIIFSHIRQCILHLPFRHQPQVLRSGCIAGVDQVLEQCGVPKQAVSDHIRADLRMRLRLLDDIADNRAIVSSQGSKQIQAPLGEVKVTETIAVNQRLQIQVTRPQPAVTLRSVLIYGLHALLQRSHRNAVDCLQFRRKIIRHTHLLFASR